MICLKGMFHYLLNLDKCELGRNCSARLQIFLRKARIYSAKFLQRRFLWPKIFVRDGQSIAVVKKIRQ